MNNALVGPFFVEEGVKLNSENYINFFTTHFVPWFNGRPKTIKNRVIFMQKNAPALLALHHELPPAKSFKEKRYMVWPAQSPDLNCIENLWVIVKRDLYANGKQYKSKPELKEAIVNILSNVEGSLIKKNNWLHGFKNHQDFESEWRIH